MEDRNAEPLDTPAANGCGSPFPSPFSNGQRVAFENIGFVSLGTVTDARQVDTVWQYRIAWDDGYTDPDTASSWYSQGALLAVEGAE